MATSAAPTQHPSDAVLLDHVSGALGMAHHLVVATHAAGCAACAATIGEWEQIGGMILEPARGAAPPAALLEKCLATIATGPTPVLAPAPSLPWLGDIPLPTSLHGLRPSRPRRIAPGIRHSTLWHDDRGTLHLIRVRPGVSLPAHRHRGLELTCVLSGAFHDSAGRYRVGDVTEEDADDDATGRADHHLVVADAPADCVCIMAVTGKLRFSGWIARALQPIMPF